MRGGGTPTWREGSRGRAAGAGRGPGRGAGGDGVRCPRCRGGGRRAAGAELRASTGWRRRRESCRGCRAPRARKSARAGSGEGRGRARGRCAGAPARLSARRPGSPLAPRPSPSPLPSAPPSRSLGGGGTREARLQARTPQRWRLRAPERLTWGRGTGRGGSPPLGAGRRARRGRSSPRRPPSALLLDSVPGAALRDGAGPPPPPTEDAPRRLEACVSSSARESGLG